MFRRYKLKNFDFLLVLLVIALNVIGILAIGSAKQSVQSKQILGMAVGLIAMPGNRLFGLFQTVEAGMDRIPVRDCDPHSGSFFRKVGKRCGALARFGLF